MTGPTHAILYPAPGADPDGDRVTVGRTRIVPIHDVGDAAATALELVAGGVGLIELCGGFSLLDRARVAAAVQSRARVSSITYGIESLDAAARFKVAYDRGETPKEAFLLLDPNASLDAGPFVVTPNLHPTTIVPVRDVESAARWAHKLAADGVLLIELYGGFTTDDIARVLQTVDGRAAVGVGSFALDAVTS